MKIMALAALAAFIGAGAALADPAEGTWRTQPGDSGGYLHVDIYGCDDALCGVIRKAISSDGVERGDYEHLNRRMLWNMQPQGDGAYGGGKIWAPDRDKTYNSKMQLSGDSLTVEGCVLGFCRGQTWARLR